uniref:autotransporter-associated beta strand repeat-containing protein n=1 Tax=Limnohabitans sp. TaxID=1907725 RepID=UPI0040484B25
MRVLPQFRLRSVVIGCRAALRQTTLWTAVFGMLVTPYAPTYATELPEGAVVESGGVSINPISATRLQINQTTQSGVINWRSFSISEDARVDFIQPNSNASTLNRVTGGQVSQIRGQLNANGRVVLVNPAGILFTANAEVNVGALVASTLDISTQDFLSGQETYGGASSNAVINQGKLKANAGGYIAMVAAQVTNAGTIESPSGSVLLAAGQRVRIDMGGPLQIEVEAGALNAHIESGGGIRASDGLVYLTAKAANDLLASAINHTGIIEAAGLTSVGGRVVLEADTVTLAAGASLSATGFTGGGDVLVGGDWQGGNNAARRIFDNPDQLREATTVTMEAGASIDASATDRGDGGTVVLWSDVHDADAVTTANGHISATGGDNGGDGGDIETSGHKLLVDALSVDASAGQGVGGEWLLDPYNISISSAATSGTGDSSASGVQTYAAAGSSSNINVGTITSALGGGTSVTVTTGSSGSDLGDIVVSAAITSAASSDVRLRLQAANSIIVNNAITASGSGKLHIELDADSDNGTRDGGGIVMLSADIATNGGDLTFGGTTSNGATGGDLYVDGGASAITATTNGGAVNINGQLIVSTSHATGFSINSGGGNVNIGGSIDSGNSYTFFSASSGGSWLSAAQDAKNGTNGGSAEGDSYLVSITSKLENSIATYKAGYRGAWIGAYRDPNTTSWYWVGGPEAGGTYAVSGASPLTAVVGANDTSFFTQSSGSNLNTAGQYSNGSLTSSGVFANFGAAEPNGSGTGGENVGQFFGALGLWNDLSKGTSYSTSDSPYAVWGYLRETNAAPSVVNINAGAGSLTLSAATGANKALASLNVTAGGLTASAVNTTAGVNVTTSAASVISGVVSGTGALTKAGTGTLTLSGASTYTGATNVNDGTLKITGSIYSNVNSNPSTAITTVASGATLDLTNWGWAGSLGTRYYESNALVIDGGTLRYSGASDSSATRGFTVTSAGATFDSATAGVTWGLDVSATASYVPVIGGSLRFTGAGHTSFSQAITGTGVTLTKEGAGILTLTGINTYTGNTTVSGGTLQVGSAAALGGGTYSGALSIASGATFDYASTAAQLLMGTVSGAGAVLKSGAGTLSLLGNNTFSGGLTLSAGTLGVYTNTGAGTGDITLGEGTSMLLGRAVTSIANDITLAGNATIGLDTLVEYLVVGGGGGGGAHVGGGGGGGGVLHSSANLVDSSYSVVVGDGGVGGTTTSYGVVSQAPSNGGASLLGNIEAYGGGAGGHWDYVEPNAGSPLVGSGGGSGDSTAGGAGTAGQGNSGGAGDGIWTYGYQSGGGGGAGGVGQAYDHASGAGSGDGGVGLYIDWANALALGQGGYVGGGGGGGLHSEMANYDAGVGGLGGGGAGSEYVSTAANGVANTGGGGGGAGLPSDAQSTGGRGGSGLVVTRYLGGSVGSGGTQSSAIGGYTSNIFASDGTLSFNAIDVVLSGTVSGTGALSLDADGGTLSLSGTNTYTGNTTVAAGAVRVAGAGSLGAGRYAGNIVNSGSFEYASSVAQVLSGVISGVGTASKSTGSSTLTLSGTNTYSGTTTVSAGTLIVTNAAGLGSTASGTAVASGAVLDLQGVAVGGEALSLSGGTLSTSTGTSSLSGAVALGANSTVAVAGSALTLSGVVSGAGYGITKTGAGNLTLSGANTYSGTTTVSAGTLAVANAAGLGSAAAGTVVAIGAVLDLQGVAVGGEALSLNGGTLSTSTGTSSLSGAVALGADSTVAVDGSGLTLSGVVSGTGFGITKTSSGTLTLTGSNTYTGDTTISAGTLALASTGSLSASTDLLMSGSAIWDLQTAQSVSSLVMGAGNQITNSAGASALTVTGTATLANSVTTKGAQTFGGAVKLASDTTLNVTAADITFNDSVDSADASNPSSLTVNVTPGTTYYWVDWTTATSTSATGNITIGSNVVSVTYNNPNGFLGAQTSSGINYWTGNPSPYESASVANGPSTSDIIKLYRSGTQTITFSQPLENLAFAVVSLNGNGYAFDQDFSIVSSSATSAGYWGVGSLSRTVDGSAFKLNGVSGEPHGVIRFTGAFDSLSWESLSAENWNGFTVGVSGVSDAAGGVRFNGVVGAGATLGAVTIGGLLETSANVQAAASVSVAGITTLGGHVTTSGAQTYQSKTTLNGVNSTLTGVNISLADVTLGANTLTLTEGGAGAVSGTISGAGIVTKAGSGTVTLSGANSYAGGTTVSAGVLKAGVSSLGSVTSGAFGTSGVAVASGAALDVAGFTVANALSLAGTGVSGSGAVYNSTSTPGTLSGAMTLVGDTSIKGNAGALTISGAINGAHALDITTTNKTFTQSGVVGATSAPTGFTVNAGTGNVTLSATQTVAGPITVYGGNIFVNESLNTTGGGSAGDVLLKASGLANLSNNKSITTAGGDIVLWSNTENATSGTANNPVVLVGSNDLSTSGGKIIIAGGLDDKLADGTSGSDGIPDGYTYRSANDATWSAHLGASVNLDSAGGDIIIRGQGGGVGVGFAGGFTVDAGAGDLLLRGLSSSQDGVLLSTSAGTTGTLTTSSGNLTVIGLSDPDATGSTLARTGVRTSGGGTIEVVAGTGVVSMDGQGSRYGVALGVGSGSYAKDGTTTLIQSGGNAAAAITLSGTGGHGLTLRGASSKIHATGASGGITLSGTSSSWSSAVYSPLELLAVSGPISWLNSDATNGIYTANATITIGSKAGVNGLSSSASDVTVNVKKLEGSPTFAIGTTGAVTIQGVDGSDAFGQNFSTSQFGLNANGQTMGAFTFGSVGNTASLTFNTDVQASGPIAAHAGNLTLSAGTTLTAGAGSDIVLVASGDFINNAGASALAVSGGGRWIVYAGDTTGNTYGSLNSGNQGVFNKTYATLAPASVAAGNRYVIGNAGSQTITVTTTDATKFYGNTIDLSSNYTLTSSGVAGVSGVYLGVSAAAGSVTSAYVFATTPTVTSTGAPVTQNVGTASITASGGVANTGYALSYSNTGTITITARPITVTATDKTKVYSDANPALTYTLIDNDGDSTLPNGDALGGSLTTSVTSTTGAGTWAGSITRGSLGATSTNYDISFIAGSFEVTPKALSVSGLTVADKVYDGTTTASISAAGNLVGKTAADNVSYVQTGAAFADKNTGVGKTVTVSGIGLTGADAVNYSIASTATTTADITAKALTLSGFA